MKRTISMSVLLDGSETIELDDSPVAPTLRIENLSFDFYSKASYHQFRKAIADELRLIVPEASADPEQIVTAAVGVARRATN
jgi:hypothetical protein